MPDLQIAPSSPAFSKKPWALRLRWHDSLGPAEYHTLCYLTDEEARHVAATSRDILWLGKKKGPSDEA